MSLERPVFSRALSGWVSIAWRNSDRLRTLSSGRHRTQLLWMPFAVATLLLSSTGIAYAATTFTAYGWGYNQFGQIGDGTVTEHSSEAITLAAGVTSTAISAGYGHSLAIGSDGNLYAWGYNEYGQVGNGTLTEQNTPEVVTLATGVTPTAISAGQYHSLAIGSDGKLYAWGYNATGQLGNGTATDEESPKAITLGAGVIPVAIAARTEDSYAIGSNGKLYAWGTTEAGRSEMALPPTSTAPKRSPSPRA